jgi:hypothetical protein
MPATKQEYKECRIANPTHAFLAQLHTDEITTQFDRLPRPILMSWADYDKYIHLNDLCAYDLTLAMLGFGIRLGRPAFALNRERTWRIAVGRHTAVLVVGKPVTEGYLVSLQKMTPTERRQ